MKRALLICLFLLTAVQVDAKPAPKSYPWNLLARQVGENEKSRPVAIAYLNKIKDLKKVLVTALDTRDRSLALDVVVALKMETLIPELLEHVSSDQDGFLVLAINSFLNGTSQDKILIAYVDHLTSERSDSAAAIIAMLEPLGRAERVLPNPALTKLLEHDFPEVRSATLSYVRMMMKSGRHREFVPLVLTALKAKPYQLRIQALFLVAELNAAANTTGWMDMSSVQKICDAELNISVKPWCTKVLSKEGVE